MEAARKIILTVNRMRRMKSMKKIILALIIMLALFSGINPNIKAQNHDTNHDHEHDDDDHDGCHFFFFDD